MLYQLDYIPSPFPSLSPLAVNFCLPSPSPPSSYASWVSRAPTYDCVLVTCSGRQLGSMGTLESGDCHVRSGHA